jgi:hypothetical protein
MSAEGKGRSSSKVVLIFLGVLGLLLVGGGLVVVGFILAVVSVDPLKFPVIDSGTPAELGGTPAPVPVPVTSSTPVTGTSAEEVVAPAPVPVLATSSTPVRVYGPGESGRMPPRTSERSSKTSSKPGTAATWTGSWLATGTRRRCA